MLSATCPFCGLLCDDLLVESDSDTLRPLRGACERSRAAFAALSTPAAVGAVSRVHGTQTSTAAALDAAADILRRARRPLLSGLAVDIDGTRAVLALARRVGAVVDHFASPVKYRNLHVLQEAGWITTTLAEVKNRADLLVLIGDGWHQRFPRFVERVIEPDTGLFGSPLPRKVILLDQNAAACAGALPARCERLSLGIALPRLPQLLGVLSALAAGRPVGVSRYTEVDTAALETCNQWLQAAGYGVIVWAAPDIDIAHAELALQALARLLRTLNRTRRFAALPLAGSNGDLSANAVHTWQSGVAFPASYANRSVDFDPHRYAAAAVLSRGEADCLVWFSSLSAEPAPPAFDGPTHVFGRADMHLTSQPSVFVPVATPGIDAAGALMRTDKVVSLFLQRLRSGALPPVAQVVQALIDRLEGR
jgi:formylmethanofuran dehydrogenase subunit B